MLFSFPLAATGRGFIVALALVALPWAGQAQGVAVAAAPRPVVALASLPASSAALPLLVVPADARRDEGQRLFRRRRVGGIVWIAIGSALFTRILVSSIARSSDQVLTGVAAGLFVGAIPLGIGAGKLNRFSRQRENQALGAYDNGGAFPPYVEKRLN